MLLYERIKKVAETKNLSIYKIEKKAGISQNTIQRWSKSTPSADKLFRVAKVLNVPMEELLSDDEESNGKD